MKYFSRIIKHVENNNKNNIFISLSLFNELSTINGYWLFLIAFLATNVFFSLLPEKFIEKLIKFFFFQIQVFLCIIK